MSWDPPEPAIEPNVEHLKTVCAWKKDLSGPLHACAGAWTPGQWNWTMRGNETYCGVWLPRTTDVAYGTRA